MNVESSNARPRHLQMAEEKARCAESRAEEMEQRFRERMETSLSFELAKIEALKRRARCTPLGPELLLGWVGGRGPDPAAMLGPADEGIFRQLHDLRQRYQRLQAATNCRAQLSSEEVRRRLSHFYMLICPSKLGNVPRVVDSFEARGATQQALRDLNDELRDTYGCDLYTAWDRETEADAALSESRRTSPHRLPLQERLAMLSDDAISLSHHRDPNNVQVHQVDDHFGQALPVQPAGPRLHPNANAAQQQQQQQQHGPSNSFTSTSVSELALTSLGATTSAPACAGPPSPRWAGAQGRDIATALQLLVKVVRVWARVRKCFTSVRKCLRGGCEGILAACLFKAARRKASSCQSDAVQDI